MAKPIIRNSSLFALSFLLVFFFVGALSTAQVKAALGGGKVGGRTKIGDVKTNKEIQELGKYCVEEYNRVLKKTNGSTAVVFMEVVEAERQVVSGIKYYLKISAAAASASSGVPKTFNAVILVKPWAHSKDLLSFSPSRPVTK